MSKNIDERVVSMQFDNKHFEKNVQVTMGTLDKLKQKLNFKGATKGLEDINAAANKVDMSGAARGVEAFGLKFNALDVMAVTALTNITNSAMNAGKRIASALTIDPVKTGLQEYETQINAVQTILANTSSKGTDINDVNKALDELNAYADMTIYNFTEMTRNIGTFTAAGIDLETSVNAIQGIANLAAVSGSTSQQASTAMYQLSQALAAGSVKLMDWNSVVNAGMGGELFQNALKKTSSLLGTGAEQAIKASGSFRESLKDGWLTAEVLTETLKTFTTSGANEYVAEYTGLTQEAVQAALKEAEARYGEADAIKYASEALAEKSGKNKEEIQSALQFAKTAQDAATKVKTFTQLWDVSKEAAQSGWTQTWEIIIGDFEEAKELFTPLSDFLTGVINGMSDARNKLLEGALGSSPLAKLAETITTVTAPAQAATKAVEEFGTTVNKVLKGSYGNGTKRYNQLTEAGINYYKVQNKVNEKLGNSFRYTQKQIEAQDKYLASQGKIVETQEYTISRLAEMSDEQLKNVGYTEEQIDALRQLKIEAEKVGMPIEEFIENLDDMNGRTLLIKSFKNIGQGLVKVITAIKDAWSDAFPPMQSETLYNIIAGIHRLSTYFAMTDETADKLTRTFKGLFAIVDIIANVFTSGFKIAYEVVKTFLSSLGIIDISSLLDVTAALGDAISKFRDWVEEHNVLKKAIEFIVPLIVKMGEAIWDFAKKVYQMEEVQSGIKKVADAFKTLGDYISKHLGKAVGVVKEAIGSLKNLENITFDDILNAFKKIRDAITTAFTNLMNNIPEDMFSGFINGVKSGASDILKVMMDLANKLLDKVKEVLGIHSPSTEFKEIGGNIIAGLIEGLKGGLSAVVETIKTIASEGLSALGKVDFGALFAAGSIVGFGLLLNKIINIIGDVVSPLENFGNLLDNIGDTIKQVGNSISKNINAKTMKTKSDALWNVAKSIALMAGALYLLSRVSWQDLLKGGIALGVLVGAMMILMSSVNKLDNLKGFDSLKLAGVVIGISVGMLIMASAIKKLAKIPWQQAAIAITEIVVLIAALSGMMWAYGTFVKGKAAQNIDKTGKMIYKLGKSLLIIAITLKILSTITGSDITKGLSTIAAIEMLFAGLMFVSSVSGKHADKAGKMLWKMALAIGVLAVVMKLIATMTWGDIGKGLAVIAGIELLFAGLIFVSFFAGEHANKAGTMLRRIAVAIGILAIAMKLIATMSQDEISRGLNMILEIGKMFMALIAVSLLTGKNASKAGSLMLKMAGAVLILALTVKLIATIDTKDVIRGFAVISAFEILCIAMVAVSKLAGNNASKAGSMLLKMSVSILILAGAIALLAILNPEDVVRGTACISALMICLIGLIAVTKLAQDCSKTLISLIVAFGLLVAGVVILSVLDPDRLITATTCVGTLLGMFALLVASTKLATGSIGVLIVMTLAIGLIGGMIYLLAKLPVESVLGVSAALSILLLSLSATCLILSAVGATGPAAIVGALVLDGVIIAIGGLLVGLGALVNKFPTLEKFLDKGIDLLVKLGYGLGKAVGSFIGGMSDGVMSGLPAIGTHLSNFMTNLQPFIDGAKQIDEKVATGVKSLAAIVLALTAADILDSLTSWATGGNSFVGFGEQLAAFGPYMAAYANSIMGIDSEAVVASANAAKALAEMADAIPNMGGLASFFAGENDMATFGTQLIVFGSCLQGYSTAVTGINTEAIETSVTAGKSLAELADSIPNLGGVVGFFMGDNSMATFGTEIVTFGMALNTYAASVLGLNVEAIETSVTAAKSLAGLQGSLDKMGGVITWFTGKKDLGTFGKKLVEFAESLNAYDDELESVSITRLTSSTSQFEKIAGLAKSLNDVDFGGMNSFTKSLSTLAKNGISGFVTTFETAYDTIKETGKNLVKKVIEGVESQQTSLNTSFMLLAANTIAAINTQTYYSAFKSVGEYLAEGFANGINSKDSLLKVRTSAQAMAKAAEEAARKQLEINSPSKVFYRIGEGTGEGFVDAMNDQGSVVYRASRDLATMAKTGFSNTISKIADAINMDIDTQPTIRPVLDLSDISAGAGAIGSMLDVTPSVGVLANVRSVGSMMNRRIQNGSDSGIISAIKDLKDSFNNTPSNTYNLNGITYDDGSNISSAVQAIVRAAVVERRK